MLILVSVGAFIVIVFELIKQFDIRSFIYGLLFIAVYLTLSYYIRKAAFWVKYVLIFFVFTQAAAGLFDIYDIFTGAIDFSLFWGLIRAIASCMALVFLSKAINLEADNSLLKTKFPKLASIIILITCAIAPMFFYKHQAGGEMAGLIVLLFPIFGIGVIACFLFVDYWFSETRVFVTILFALLTLIAGFGIL